MAERVRVLVSGASGFIGANLSRLLLRDGFDVQLLIHGRENTWRLNMLGAHAPIYEADLCDREATERAVQTARPDWVFHCAVYGAYSWQNDFDQMVRTNVLGTSHLLEACLRAGAQSFVNTGSSSEYGFQDHAPSEDEPIYPNSEYAVTKASATLYCKFVGETRQAPVRTLRLYSVYGPMEDPGRLMPTLVREGLAGRLPPLVDPNVARDFVWVEDVYDAYRLVAASLEEDRGAIYNVGTGRQTSMREVVQTASRVLHLQVEPAWSSMLNRRWDTDRWVCDARKFRRTFGWRPRVDLEEGLQRMATWQREKDVLTAIALPASPTA